MPILFIIFILIFNEASAEIVFFPNPDYKSSSYNSRVMQNVASLEMLTQANKAWPSCLIQGEISIDLYPYMFLNAEIKNESDQAGVVFLSVKDFDAHTVYTSKKIEAGKSAILRLKLLRKDDAWRDIELFGMRTMPWMQRLEEPADLRRVKELVISLEKTNLPQKFLIQRVFADGKYKALELPKNFFPFVDKYGQYKHKKWDGKILNKQNLINKLSREELTETTKTKYMGIGNSQKFEATGAFCIKYNKGKWMLIDPEGYPFYSMGVNAVIFSNPTPVSNRQHWFEIQDDESFIAPSSIIPRHGFYKGKEIKEVDFLKWNLYRKYGQDYQSKIVEQTLHRFRSWGINTIGAWSDHRLYAKKIPYTVILHPWSPTLKSSRGHYGELPDVYDPEFSKQIERSLFELDTKILLDEYCIGFFIHNELPWGDETNIAYWVLSSYGYQPAKKEFVKEMRNKYREIDDLNRVWRSQISSWDQLLAEPFSPNYKFASADLLAFSQKFSERYFKVCRDVIRKCAPERLYLGCRFAQNNRVASAAAAKFCDVVSVNLYHRPDEIGNYHLPGKKRNEVPLMVTEFHFGAKDRSFSSGLRGAESLEDRSKMVVEYIKSCVDHPGMIGSHWFQMYDQPLTGRVQDGENYQVGLLDVADTPYERMVRDLRELQFYWENNFMKD